MAKPAAATLSAQEHAASFSAKARTVALVIVALAFIMDLLDNTIVNIAIPSIQANIGASYATIQWLIAGYALAFATLLITGGRMGDVYGYKKIFMVGVAGFTVASLLCGASWNSTVLIIARLLQGAFAALMVPQVISLMQVMYKPHERGSIMGLFGALGGMAASLGPIIGGILIHFNIAGLDWRPIFLINLPVGLFALAAGFKYLPSGKSPHPLKLDIFGTFLVSIALFLLAFPLIQGRELHWPVWSFVLIAVSLPIMAVFVWWQRKKQVLDGSPLVVPALMRIKNFVIGLLVNLLFEGAMLAFFLPFTLILQAGLGYSVIKAALTGVPTAVGLALVMAVFSQKIIPKLGRYTMVLGAGLMVGGLVLLYVLLDHFGLRMSPWGFIPGLLLVGGGMAFVMSPMFSVSLSDVDAKHAGSASGVLNAVQQLGGAVGTALLGLVFFNHLATHAVSSFTAVTPQLRQQLSSQQVSSAAQDQIVKGAQACFIASSSASDGSSITSSCKQPATDTAQTAPARNVGTIVAANVRQANNANFVSGFRAALYFEAVVLAIIVILSFFLPRRIQVTEEF